MTLTYPGFLLRMACRSVRNKHRLFRVVMSRCSLRNGIVAQAERPPFAAHFESMPIGRPVLIPDGAGAGLTGVTFRDLIEREGRDREGT